MILLKTTFCNLTKLRWHYDFVNLIVNPNIHIMELDNINAFPLHVHQKQITAGCGSSSIQEL